ELSKPSERPVKIMLKEGEPLSGTFTNSSSEGIQLLIAGNVLTIKWDVVSQIVFTDVQQIEMTPKVDEKVEKEKESLKSALRSLRKLVAATEVLSWGKRSDFEEFGRRFIDVKAE